jgi:hypothetical protein
MAGRFDGVSDLEWQLFADIFPTPPPRQVSAMAAPRMLVQVRGGHGGHARGGPLAPRGLTV